MEENKRDRSDRGLDDTAFARSGPGSPRDLKAVVDIADRLLIADNIDALFHSAIDLARRELNVERCAILINHQDHLRGTYGTDLKGQITDERGLLLPLDEHWKNRFNHWNSKSSQWIIERDINRMSRDARLAGAANAWVATTPIKGSNNRVIAVFCNDCAITGEAPSETLQSIIAVYCSLLGSIIERQFSIDEMKQRDSVLEGAANAAARLLTEKDLGTAIHQSLRILGESMKVNRVYIFKNRHDKLTDEWYTSQIYEWVSDERLSEIENPSMQELALRPTFTRLFEALYDGRIYGGPISMLPDGERRFLQAQSILSILNVPIFIDNEFWGFMGYDDCTYPREWSSFEKTTLLSMAGSIGGRIMQDMTEKQLLSRDRILSGVADANHELLTNPVLEKAIERSLRILATSTNVERVFLCENMLDVLNGDPVMCPRHLYFKSTDRHEYSAGLERQLSYSQRFPGWHGILSSGKTIHGRMMDFLDEASDDVRTVLLAPLMIADKFWGVIGFDSLDPEHDWNDSEISTLSTMAGSIGGAIARKRAENNLRSSEEHFRSLIENTSDVILVVNDHGLILYGSPSTGRILGYRQSLLPRINFFDIIHSDDWPLIRPVFQQRETDTMSGPYRLRLRHCDDEQWISSETHVKLLEGRMGSTARFVINIRDITQRVKTEEALRQSEEMFRHSQKMEAIGRLAGGISHDFNNLLTAILGYGDLLKSQMPEGHQWRADVDEIHSAAKKAHGLTRQLLAFSRRQVMEPRHVDLNDIVRDMERLLIRLISEDYQLQTDINDSPCPVRVDRSQIEQVIINLALNARDAMTKGGQLSLKTGSISLPEPIKQGMIVIEPGEYVVLKVGDSGHGIDERIRAHIFEPFFTTKEIGKGTGLGLSMVYGTIEQSGGHILFDTEVGRGTEFTIYLPRVELADTEDSKDESRPGHRGNERILLLEDDRIVRELTGRILLNQGYRVVALENGQEGLEYFRRHGSEINLVLTDIIMPMMSGVAFARAAREINPGLRVLFMSGYSEDHQPELHETANGRNYIQKPFTVETLSSRIREILDSPAQMMP